MRSFVGVTQISTAQLDKLREDIEADLIVQAAKSLPNVGNWRVRDLLPFTDLAIVSAGQAGALTDFWGCGALVASTALIYVPNTVLQANEFVAIYGVAIPDTNPSVVKILFQTGAGASTKADINLEHMYYCREPEIVTPEYMFYAGQDTIQITLIPDAVGKAVGADGVSDHVILRGLICKPAGDVISY